jgi:hypothetical protein
LKPIATQYATKLRENLVCITVTDVQMIVLAFAHCGGYFVVAADAEKEGSKVKEKGKAKFAGCSARLGAKHLFPDFRLLLH